MDATRRNIMFGAGATIASLGLGGVWINSMKGNGDTNLPETIPISERSKELAYLASVVRKSSKWEPGNLFKFVNALSDRHLDPFGQSLEITDYNNKNKAQQIEAIHREILWQSSSIFTYPFKSLEAINYHDVVVWCASNLEIPKNEARFTSTWDLEHLILERQFASIWDNLSEERRIELLAKIDTENQIEDKIKTAALTFKEAQTALALTVYFTGFSFYTTMSTVVSTVAGWVGLTLPFSAYTTLSSAVAVLAGPIGWAIGAVMLAGTFAAWAGKPDLRKTLTTVMQIHSMKAGALYGGGEMV